MNEKVLIKGNIAIAEAAIKSGVKAYFGYPITPQTDIGEYLSSELPKRNLAYVCAESELAAINMALGAATSGEKVMVSSSSCAISLMQETLSYACSDELPIVLVNVMRAGPGQGYIYPSQGDYNQAVVGGGNGDYRIIVLSPSNLTEAVDLVQRAFYLSQKYRNPVMLLADGLLGQMAEPVIIKDYDYPEIDNSSWVLNGAKNRPPREIRSLEPSQNKLNMHIYSLFQKYKNIEKYEVDFEEYMCNDAEIIITAFGTLARYAKSVVKELRQKEIKIGLFRPKTLYPFPYKKLNELTRTARQVIDVEMNMGQMLKDVRLAVSPRTVISFLGKPVGDWLKKEEIIEIIEQIRVKEENASI